MPYAPGWDPTEAGYDAYTLDLSHCAASRIDSLAMADRMGAGLKHVHLGDGTGEGRDEHLVPGRGNQPCAELLRSLAGAGLHAARSRWRSPPARRPAARSARPTCASRSSSPAGTWHPPSDAGEPGGGSRRQRR